MIDCVDDKRGSEKRPSLRPLHLRHLDSVRGDIVTAGPKLKNGKLVGSALIIDFADRAAAEDFAATDPYNKGGVFARVTVFEYKKVF